jgi:hypothetical protein
MGLMQTHHPVEARELIARFVDWRSASLVFFDPRCSENTLQPIDSSIPVSG